MDPQSEKTPGLHLPQPSIGEGAAFPAQYEEMPQRPEYMTSTPEATASSPLQPSAVPAPAVPAVPPVPANDQARAATTAPADDDSTDELDTEWINKAKHIVEQTKADPYIQSKEISKVKADYLRIRYNKHIKVGQDKAS